MNSLQRIADMAGVLVSESAINPNLNRGSQSRQNHIAEKSMNEDVEYDDDGNIIPTADIPQEILQIARQLGFKTLEMQNSDRLDFKEISAAGLKDALMSAYKLGQGGSSPTQATPPQASRVAPPPPSTPQSPLGPQP